MNKIKSFKLLGFTFLLSVCLVASAAAKVTSDEAAKLCKELTPFGAEVAGNADVSIPAWDGGLAHDPTHVTGERHANPFASDKVLFTITGKNADQYADKLSDGQLDMLKKYPEFRMDVFQSRRTHSAPQKIYDNTLVNATKA